MTFVAATAGKRPLVSLRHLPPLDGLRAVALTGVLLVHGMPAWLPGGFLGVDLFFVLSGFLITSLLLREAELTGRIPLRGFWARRMRRLLPALVVLVCAVVAAGPYLLPEQEPGALRSDAVAALTYWANWRMIARGGDYFTETAAASPLQHTWSLAIEEQFYLLWPLLILLAVRTRRPRRLIGAVCAAGFAASAVAAAVLYDPLHPGRAYFGSDTRAAALLAGCALAAALPVAARHPVARRAAALAGAAVLGTLAAFAGGGDARLFRGGFALAAVAAAAVLAELAAAPATPVARLLGAAPLAWLGRISYGGYLWHWPLFAVLDAGRTGLAGPRLLALRLAVTVAVAAASFHLVEQPLRRPAPAGRARWAGGWPARRTAGRARRAGGWSTRRTAGLAVTVTAAAAVVVVLAGPAPVVVPPPVLAAAPADASAPAAPPQAGAAAGAASGAAPPVRRAERRPGPPRVMVIGDSVSWTLGAYWPDQTDFGFSLHNEGVQGCGIAVLPELRYGGAPHTNYPYCGTWEYRWGGSTAAQDPDVVVVLLDRWELMDRKLDGRWTHVGEPAYDAYLAGQLRRAVELTAGRGARVALLTAPYTRRQERPDGGLWPEDTQDRVDAWNRLLAEVAAAHPSRPVVLDLNRVLCPDGAFTWKVGGVRVRSDGLHLTPEGVRQVVAPWLAPQLLRLATT
ncbi:acyltransferase family protein [Dactylosporangium aurantiacum]|uniref:Acyltransferase family protein n=1 Tax=Dactylosporangium aurantiacum TaxID=35754 RepID=A0A9Q9MIK7_9ACTN|nr:acyltransferase family protein [Dactylosporangium aurantiacum]MDG6105785.1 acyltransferase family protein [Dactylosporangium aurantiacum]UWZ58029.1 acyltransferase family protein [Dactylosporangium aurantiacum]